MATYSSYRSVATEEIADNSLTDANFAPDAAKNFGVKWVYGDPGACTPGCCCLWTVPAYVKTVTFEVWEPAAMAMVPAHVIDVNITTVRKAEAITPKQFLYLLVGIIQYVQAAFIAAIVKSVTV